MARPKGVGGRPGAGHSPPTSWRAGARRPCRPPQRSLPSCPSEVSAPPGIRGKLRPDAGRLLDSRWGAGPGRPGRGCAAGSRRRRGGRPAPGAPVSWNRACRQHAAAGEWGGEQARLEEGGDWRRGREEEGRRKGGGAGGGVPPRLGGRCASLRGARAAASPRPRSPLWRPYPFPPGLHPAAGQRGPASGVFGTEGRMLAEVEGSVHERSRDAALAGPRAQRRDVSPADCTARAEPSGLGGWGQADLPSPPPKSTKERVGGCVGALAHHKPHALPGAREARSRRRA